MERQRVPLTKPFIILHIAQQRRWDTRAVIYRGHSVDRRLGVDGADVPLFGHVAVGNQHRAQQLSRFLMVFLIQNTQNRDARAVHLKLDELLRSGEKARNYLIDLQHMSDEELDELEREFKICRKKRAAVPEPRRNGSRATTPVKISALIRGCCVVALGSPCQSAKLQDNRQ